MRCGAELGQPITQLFRMENVVTKRRDNINSDEEERRRMGYDIITGVRFGVQGGQPSFKLATVEVDGQPIAKLNYGNTATLWRINLGFRRRADKTVRGPGPPERWLRRRPPVRSTHQRRGCIGATIPAANGV